ncbi:MAG: hypothetical protein ACJ749_12445 [Flavisolibacter sp.]
MDTKQKQFEEQDHPLKNTDRAFVQVGTNGEPVIPTEKAQEKKNQQDQKQTVQDES